MSANDPTPAAKLRQLLSQLFSKEELAALCFDLGVDYDSLPGDGTMAKVVEIIEYFSRAGRIKALVQLASTQRVQTDWGELLTLAQSQPNAFRSDAVSVPISKDVVNLPPNRALKLGFAAGVLAVMILVCGFGGGLLAGQVIDVTVNPVPPNQKSLEKVSVRISNSAGAMQGTIAPINNIFNALTSGQLRRGTRTELDLDNVQLTTFADSLVDASAPITDVHVQSFKSRATVNMRVKVLGDRRVLVAYTAATSGGKVILTPQSAWLNVVEIDQSTFGWVPLPVSFVANVTQWIQRNLDTAASAFRFDDVTFETNKLTVKGRTL
jgi:Effector-associated domain 7